MGRNLLLIVPVMLILLLVLKDQVLVLASLVLVPVLAGPVLGQVLFLNLACNTRSIQRHIFTNHVLP